MVDIFDEVSDDLRAERAKALLRRYGVVLVAALVLVVLGVAGWQAWRWRQKYQSDELAGRFIAAMRLAGTPGPADGTATPSRTEAAQQFDALAAAAPGGYRTLARLRAAALKAGSGDLPAALAEWDKVSADTTADPLLRGVADLMWVQHQVDAGDPAAVEGRIAPLIVPGSPWRPLALESQAWLALRTGDQAKARDILRQLRADTTAPDGVRGRASGLLARLGEGPAPEGGTAERTGG